MCNVCSINHFADDELDEFGEPLEQETKPCVHRFGLYGTDTYSTSALMSTSSISDSPFVLVHQGSSF